MARHSEEHRDEESQLSAGAQTLEIPLFARNDSLGLRYEALFHWSSQLQNPTSISDFSARPAFLHDNAP